MKFVTAQQMQEIDRVSIEEYGIPSLVLMENAGVKTVQAIEKIIDSLQSQKIVIVAGMGNNGGDGFVIARHLHNRGAKVQLIVIGEKTKIKNDPLVNLNIVEKQEIPVIFVTNEEQFPLLKKEFRSANLLVDAIFGTGLQREITGLYYTIITMMNESSVRIIAVDLPSGVCADTGQILGVAIQASITVSMGLPKIGLLVHPGITNTGKLFIADIGFPKELLASDTLKFQLMTREKAVELLPKRGENTHKGSFGHVFLLGGSDVYPGAMIMAALGSLKCGAGLTTVASTSQCLDLVITRLPEVIRHDLQRSNEGFITEESILPVINEKSDNVIYAIGPGAGRNPQTLQAIVSLFMEVKNAVLDADGIHCLVNHGTISNGSNKLLTPHPGEAAALLGVTVEEVQHQRIKYVKLLAEKYQVNVLLKGAGTLIASPTGEVTLSRSGNSSLAKGGTGDVLTGMIAALMAQGLRAYDAACLGTWIHGRAAEELSALGSEYSVLATEIAEKIGQQLEELTKKQDF
jgi:NAD(P)H-hydrate epimerase